MEIHKITIIFLFVVNYLKKMYTIEIALFEWCGAQWTARSLHIVCLSRLSMEEKNYLFEKQFFYLMLYQLTFRI
jgi:hypothetical protein